MKKYEIGMVKASKMAAIKRLLEEGRVRTTMQVERAGGIENCDPDKILRDPQWRKEIRRWEEEYYEERKISLMINRLIEQIYHCRRERGMLTEGGIENVLSGNVADPEMIRREESGYDSMIKSYHAAIDALNEMRRQGIEFLPDDREVSEFRNGIREEE